jgi:hypothetical protein
MISGLHEADRADALLARTLEHGLHQLTTNGLVLHAEIDRDRSHPCNCVRLPKKVAADDTPIPFRDDGVDIGSRQQMANEISRNVCVFRSFRPAFRSIPPRVTGSLSLIWAFVVPRWVGKRCLTRVAD